VSDITKRYGGVYALKGASFTLRAGEVHALMGENGAGKSTLARIIAGSARADGGRIALKGAAVEIASPRDAQRLGVGIIYQELDLFPNLTAGENMVFVVAFSQANNAEPYRAAQNAFLTKLMAAQPDVKLVISDAQQDNSSWAAPPAESAR